MPEEKDSLNKKEEHRLTIVEYKCGTLEKIQVNVCDKLDLILSNHLPHIQKSIDSLDEKFDKRYVNIDRFKPIEKVVYGLVGVICTSVIVAIIALVLEK